MLLSVFAANQLYRKRVWQPALVTCHRAPIMMKYLSRASILPMFLMISALPGQGAESVADLSEQDFLADVPVVLTASRLRQNVADAPAAVTVIDRQMIRDSGAWSIPDLFRLVPGMYVGESADRGTFVPNSVVSYHGLTDGFSRRMQVLVDGRSIYTPLFGGAVWSTLPLALEDIERIEVIRGPNSATYGANSFLGIINIISRHATETQGAMVSLTDSKRGSDATFRWGGKAGALDYRVTGSQRRDQGITDFAAPDASHSTVPNRFDNKLLSNFTFRGDLQISDRDALEIQAGLSQGDHQSGKNELPGSTTYSPEHVRKLDSYYGLLRWQRSFSADEQLSIKAYANRDEQNYDLASLVVPHFGVVPAPFDSPMRLLGERYDLEAQHTLAPTSTTRLVWGAGVRIDRFTSRFFFNSDQAQSFRQSNLFANLEWRPSARWVFNGGLMLENNSYTGSHASPRLAANYHVVPGHTLRVSASRATHTPVMLEAKADSRWTFPLSPINCLILKSCTYRAYGHRDDLQSEQITSREVGYVMELPGGSLDIKYSLDHLTHLLETEARGFSGSMINPLTGQILPGVQYNNLGSADIRALEAQWQQKFTEATRLHVAWSMTKVTGNGASRDSASIYSDSAPLHSRSMLLAHDFGSRWTGSLAYYQMGRMAVQGDGDVQNPYERVDARLAYRFRDGAYQGEVAFIVQNLFDKPYQEVYYENLIGRRSYVNLRLEF